MHQCKTSKEEGDYIAAMVQRVVIEVGHMLERQPRRPPMLVRDRYRETT